MVSAVCNPALESFLARLAPEMIFGDVLLRRTDGEFELCHAADREVGALRAVAVEELRELAQWTEEKQFRPLKSAPTLRRGWRCVARDAAELDEALRHLYPGAVADWFAAQQSPPPVTHYREFTARQSGMYRITTLLTDEQVGQVARAGCHRRFCLKQRLWTVEGLPPEGAAEKSLLPCLEPCAVLMEFARTVVRIEQEAERDGPAPVKNLDRLASELELRSELERQAQAWPAGMRVADFSAADNPRRAQWRLEKLSTGRAVKGD